MFRAPDEALAFTNLEQKLPEVQPYLYNLADQVIEEAPHSEWNVLIGDDTSGRLPTFFIRRVLAESGYKLPTYYVAASKRLQNQIGPEPYVEYFDKISDRLAAPLKPLVITESVGTGDTLSFVKDALGKSGAERIDIAAVGNRDADNPLATIKGGEGGDVMGAVFFSFESVSLDSLGKLATLNRKLARRTPVIKNHLRDIRALSSAALTGLETDTASSIPITCRKGSNPHTSKAYILMESVVEAYLSQHALKGVSGSGSNVRQEELSTAKV